MSITTCLWFDTEGEEAATLYVSLFENSRITGVTRYGEGGLGPVGAAQAVTFELDGQPFLALNGGPGHPFNDAVSFQIPCRNQEEVDRYWDRLAEGGEPGRCGWLRDRFGVSWQVVPDELPGLLGDPDPDRARRATEAMLTMGKLDVEALKAAAG